MEEEIAKMIEPKIVLIDGQRLAQLMIEYDVGVAIKNLTKSNGLIPIILTKMNCNRNPIRGLRPKNITALRRAAPY
jgi:hypothetical protein